MEGLNTKPLLFAPPVAWFSGIGSGRLIIADENIIEAQTLRNRLVYGTFQGKKQISIPLRNSTLKAPYRAVEVSYAEHWNRKMVQALRTAYGKSPFYEFYGYRFENIILSGEVFLWNLNLKVLTEVFNCLKMEVNVVFEPTECLEVNPGVNEQSYYQVFNESQPFLSGLSILDLIFNEGPDARVFLMTI